MRFKDNNWAVDLAEMGSLSSKNENVKCVINVFTKYAWVKPLKDKKGKVVLNTFIEIVNETNHKRKLRRILELLNLKLQSELLIIKIFLINVILKVGQQKYLLSTLYWKIILGLIELKITERNITGN